jgi:hypothetical protein
MNEKELKKIYMDMGMDESHAARKARIVAKREAEAKAQAEADAKKKKHVKDE